MRNVHRNMAVEPESSALLPRCMAREHLRPFPVKRQGHLKVVLGLAPRDKPT